MNFSGGVHVQSTLFLLLTASFATLPVAAQTPPNAGALRQQIEQGREPALPQQLQAAPPTEASTLPAQSGLLVTVTAFRLLGNTLADLNINSPFQWGELLNTSAMHTEGSDYLRLGATLPADYDGWRLGAHISTMNYHLVLASFAARAIRGSSDSSGLEASYPLVRSGLHNLYLSANADHKNSRNQANGATRSQYSSDSLGLSLSGDLLDNGGGGSASSASLSLTTGQLDLAGSPNQDVDTNGIRAEGAFNKLRYSISRQQTPTQDVSLYATFSGQWSDRNLDSSEKFYLGGANGVRAYPVNEAGGTLGQLLNLELRWRLPQGLNLSGFYDIGQISVNNGYPYLPSPPALPLLQHHHPQPGPYQPAQL
jgi:hemolysin activation/secretion protein